MPRCLTVTDSYHDGEASIDGRLLGAMRLFHSNTRTSSARRRPAPLPKVSLRRSGSCRARLESAGDERQRHHRRPSLGTRASGVATDHRRRRSCPVGQPAEMGRHRPQGRRLHPLRGRRAEVDDLDGRQSRTDTPRGRLARRIRDRRPPLHLHGAGDDVRGDPAPHAAQGPGVGRVSVIRSDGTELEPHFAAMHREAVGKAAQDRSWPATEGHWSSDCFARPPRPSRGRALPLLSVPDRSRRGAPKSRASARCHRPGFAGVCDTRSCPPPPRGGGCPRAVRERHRRTDPSDGAITDALPGPGRGPVRLLVAVQPDGTPTCGAGEACVGRGFGCVEGEVLPWLAGPS